MRNMRNLILLLAFTLLLLLSGAAVLTPTGHAQLPDGDASRVQQGFAIAPVPLNLVGKNPALVGLGSYLVNAVGGCNDCHTSPSYASGGNPFLGQPKGINAAHYLAGQLRNPHLGFAAFRNPG